MTADSSTNALRCPACGGVNDCAIARGAQHCWCMEQTPTLTVPHASDAQCYCRACLQQQARQLQKSPSSR